MACSASTLRFADMRTRASAASAAGFTGLGLRVLDYVDSGMPDAEIGDLLDEYGLRILELEHTWDWATGEVNDVETEVFRIADRIGIRQLNVPMFFEHSTQELVDAFGDLCDRAGNHGVVVGFEFLPYSHVRTINTAWEIVAQADRANSGLVLDLWHWFRSGATPADLAGIPATKITSLQLCDVLPQALPDMADEARHHRQLPGRGAGLTSALLKTLREQSVAAPVSVEVFSDELDALPTQTAADLAFQAAAQTLAGTGLGSTPWCTNIDNEAHR